MKIAIIGFTALIIGVGGGAFVSGSKVKTQILEEAALAHADSVRRAEVAEQEHDGESAADSTARGTDSTAEGPDSTAQGPDSTGHNTDANTHDTDVSDGSVPLDIGAAPGVDDSTHALPAVPGDTAAAGADTSAITAAIEADVAPRFDEEGAQKLSKIFGAMRAPDAADVLEEMSDNEVKAILYQMSDRLAAAILGEFAPERAAELSRVVLRDGGNDS